MHTQGNSFYQALMVSSMILAVVIGYFIYTAIKYQRVYQRLHQEKLNAEISTLENERRRIASDLHDGIAPTLAAIKMQLTSLELHMPAHKTSLAFSQKYLDEVIGTIRETAYNLLPNILIRYGLIHAMEDLVSRANNQPGGLHIYFTHHQFPELEKQKEVQLYRIAQEIIHNARKHAGATQMKILFSAKGSLLRIFFSDNGKGFDYDHAIEGGGLGLLNIQSRTDMLKGRLGFRSEKDKGSQYTIEISTKT